MTKAQITLFMLIGIVIVAGAALTFHAVQVQTQQELQKKADEVTQQLLKTEVLNEYITICLNDATEKGIKYLGEQGGVIYKSEGGSTPDYGPPLPVGMFSVLNVVEENGKKYYYDVSYAIKEPYMSLKSITNKPVPEYPYLGPVIPQLSEHLKDNHFGKVILKPLCDPNGPNKPGGVLYRSCETYGPPKSIQEELRDYVKQNLETCINFTDLSDIMGYNITRGNVSANITFTDNTVIAEATYPISITIKEKQVTKMMEFKTEIPIRLKTIYEFVNALLTREANDLFFNIETDYKNFTKNGRTYWTNGISLTLLKDACSTCTKTFGAPWDDILTITDDKSLYQGKPFKLTLAIKNRIPVLDYIHTPNPYPDLYDMVALENNTLNISPRGYDPDEDTLKYHYYLWKADYDEKFIGPTEKNVTKIYPPTYNKGNQWELSEEYAATKREAIIEVGKEDIGYHEVNVTVEDNQGLKDWQIVKILVNDNPEVKLKGYNPYKDYPKETASIEDIYILDASETKSIFDRGLTYTFIDILESQGQFSQNSPILFIPKENQDITTIKPEMFSILGPHTITLTVTDNLGTGATGTGKDSIDIKVEKCLPHTNTTHPYPYPYYNITNTGTEEEISPYQATHVCCGTDYNYKGKNVPCATITDYGGWTTNSRAQNLYNNVLPATNKKGIRVYVNNIISSESFLKSLYPNAIVEKTLKRNCTGDRGNTCEGDAELTIKATPCSPQTLTGQERCSGPPKQLLLQKNYSTTQITCENYTGAYPSTFEEIQRTANSTYIFSGAIDGLCDTKFRCGTGNGSVYNTGSTGNYTCQGTCGKGQCGTAANCTCSKTCAAICDNNQQVNTNSNITTLKCYNCDTTNCNWKNTPTKTCPKIKICTNTNGDNCITDTTGTTVLYHNSTKTEYCFNNAQCTNGGTICSYTITKMDLDKCGYCSTTTVQTPNCPQPTWLNGNCYTGCKYNQNNPGTPSCTSTTTTPFSGNCILQQTPPSTCDTSTLKKKITTNTICYYQPTCSTTPVFSYLRNTRITIQNGGACYKCTPTGVQELTYCPTPTIDFKLMNGIWDLDDTDDVCKTGCNDTCEYTYTNDKCPKYYILPPQTTTQITCRARNLFGACTAWGTTTITQNADGCNYIQRPDVVTTGKTCPYTTSTIQTTIKYQHDSTKQEWCYSGQQCTDNGCYMTNATAELRQNYCDMCTRTGKTNGQYCVTSSACTSNCPNSGIYYYLLTTSNMCTGTTCNLQTSFYKQGFIAPIAAPTICDTAECQRDCQAIYGSNYKQSICSLQTGNQNACICTYTLSGLLTYRYKDISDTPNKDCTRMGSYYSCY